MNQRCEKRTPASPPQRASRRHVDRNRDGSGRPLGANLRAQPRACLRIRLRARASRARGRSSKISAAPGADPWYPRGHPRARRRRRVGSPGHHHRIHSRRARSSRRRRSEATVRANLRAAPSHRAPRPPPRAPSLIPSRSSPFPFARIQVRPPARRRAAHPRPEISSPRRKHHRHSRSANPSRARRRARPRLPRRANRRTPLPRRFRARRGRGCRRVDPREFPTMVPTQDGRR